MPAKRLDALIAIGTLIAPNAKLAGELTRAFEDPEDYADALAAELDDRAPAAGRGGGSRGSSRASPANPTRPARPANAVNRAALDRLPWVALIRGLVRAGAVVELDDEAGAQGSPDDLRRSLEQLEDCPRAAFAWMKHDGELADRSTAELVELAGKALLARGAQLVELDGEANRRCLVVIPAGRAAELVKLAKTASYGDVALITGARLAKATKDRLTAARRSARQTTAGTTAARTDPAQRYFARGKESWTVSAAEAGFESCYEKPRVKYYVRHYFDDAAAARAGLRRQLTEWEAAGFREVERTAFDALPHAGAQFINWTAPFPDDASYVVEGKEVVRCTELRGDAVVESGGTIGYNFGERQNVYHCKTVEAAAKRYAQHVAADAHFPAISRAEVVKRYR